MAERQVSRRRYVASLLVARCASAGIVSYGPVGWLAPADSDDRSARLRRSRPACAYLCSRGLSSHLRVGVVGGRRVRPDHLVVILRQWRRSVTRRAARRAERGALDRRRVGATWCVRAGAHAYLGPRLGLGYRVGDMMVMGSPAGGRACGRSIFGGSPRERGGSAMSGTGRGASAEVKARDAHRPGRVMRARALPRRGL